MKHTYSTPANTHHAPVLRLCLTLCLAVSLHSPAVAQPVAVQFSTLGLTGQASSRSITVTPNSTTLLQTDGTNIITGPPLVIPASTNVTTNLWPGLYTITIQGVSRSFPMLVTTNFGLGPVSAVLFTTNLAWMGTNYAVPIVTKLVAGANVTLSPSTGIGAVTITATGGGGGGGGNQTNLSVSAASSSILQTTNQVVTGTFIYTPSLDPSQTNSWRADATNAAARATNTITSIWLTNKIGPGIYDGAGVAQMWALYSTNPMGSAAYHASGDFDASGAAQNATNGLAAALIVTNWSGVTNAVIVSGAGDTVVNGIYWWNGSTKMTNGAGWFIQYFTGKFRMSSPTGNSGYTNPGPYMISTWWPSTDIGPAPTVTYATGTLAAASLTALMNGSMLTNIEGSQIVGQVPNSSLSPCVPIEDTTGTLNIGSNSIYGATAASSAGSVSGRMWGNGMTASAALHSGSAAALYDLPPHGQEVWKQLPFPLICATTWWDWGTNGTSASVTNLAALLNSSGVVTALSNLSARPYIHFDTPWGWNVRDGSGNLMANASVVPQGMPWLTAWCHTKGCAIYLGQYYSSYATTNLVTCSYTGSSPGAGGTIVASTPFTVGADVAQIYAWGFDGVRPSDLSPIGSYSGYAHQTTRQWSEAVLNLTTGYPWSATYPAALMIEYIGGSGGIRQVPDVIGYEVNALTDDLGAPFSTATADGVLANALFCWTNGLAAGSGKGHYITGLAAISDQAGTLTTNVYRAALALGSMWGQTVQLTTNVLVGGNAIGQMELASITNANLLHVYLDPQANPGWKSWDNGSNSIWVKRLAAGDYAAVLYNDGSVSASMSVGWTNLNPPANWTPIQAIPPYLGGSNQLWSVLDVWSGTNASPSTNIYTSAVAAGAAQMVILTPVANTNFVGTFTGSHIGGGAGLTNLVFATNAINATNFWGLLGQSNLTLATITNNTSGNAATATTAAGGWPTTWPFSSITGTLTNANSMGTNPPGAAGQVFTSDGHYGYWAAGGGGSQTPWTGTESAAGYSLLNLATNYAQVVVSGSLTNTNSVGIGGSLAVSGAITNTGNGLWLGTNTAQTWAIYQATGAGELDITPFPYSAAFQLITNGDVWVPRGNFNVPYKTTSVSNLVASGTITGNGSGLTNLSVVTSRQIARIFLCTNLVTPINGGGLGALSNFSASITVGTTLQANPPWGVISNTTAGTFILSACVLPGNTTGNYLGFGFWTNGVRYTNFQFGGGPTTSRGSNATFYGSIMVQIGANSSNFLAYTDSAGGNFATNTPYNWFEMEQVQ